jgi:acyl carrier protein
MNSTLDTVNAIVALRAPEISSEIGSPGWLTQDLKVDSLTLVDIVTDVEIHFGLAVGDDVIEQLQSIQDILNMIDNEK